MYFLAAIRYPFQGSVVTKVVAFSLLMMLPFINLVGTILMTGYLVKVAGTVMDDDDQLPDLAFFDDIGRGIISILTSIIYLLPVALVGGLMMVLISENSNNITLLYAIVIGVCGLPGIFFGILSNIAILRYARTEDISVLWQLGQNLDYMNNIGAIVKLVANSVLAGISIMVITFIISLPIFYTRALMSDNFLVILLSASILIALNVIFTLSSGYMMGRFGKDLQIAGKSKRKNDF